MGKLSFLIVASFALSSLALAVEKDQHQRVHAATLTDVRKGYDRTETGLFPTYPSGRQCSAFTSLYASWIDVDGSRRDERHSGVDLGRLHERVLAPASGAIRAGWQGERGGGGG